MLKNLCYNCVLMFFVRKGPILVRAKSDLRSPINLVRGHLWGWNKWGGGYHTATVQAGSRQLTTRYSTVEAAATKIISFALPGVLARGLLLSTLEVRMKLISSSTVRIIFYYT